MEKTETHPSDSPLASGDAKELVARAREVFRPAQAVRDNVPTACLLERQDSPHVLAHSVFRNAEELFVAFETSEEVYRCTPTEFREYLKVREPWEDYDLLVFDKSMRWCLGVTHDEDFTLFDPENVFKSC